MIRLAFIMTILWYSVSAHSSTAYECININGVSVTIKNVGTSSLEKYDAEFGVAFTNNDNHPVIWYDNKLEEGPIEFKNLVIFHECVHHMLGHVTIASMHFKESLPLTGRLQQIKQEELQADCVAAYYLATELHYTSEHFDIIKNKMVEDVSVPDGVHANINDRIRMLTVECVQ